MIMTAFTLIRLVTVGYPGYTIILLKIRGGKAFAEKQFPVIFPFPLNFFCVF